MEILVVLAVLLPFGLGAWALAILAYVRAREAGHRARALEQRLAALEREATGSPPRRGGGTRAAP